MKRAHDRAYDKAQRVADPDRVRTSAHARVVAHRNRHPDYYRVYGKNWRATHPDYHRGYTKAFRAMKPALAHAAKHRHRARIANTLATLTAAEWDAILEAAGRACIYCGSRKRLTQDHLTPLAQGGPHTAENVAPACLSCNSSKGAQAVAEFLAEKEA